MVPSEEAEILQYRNSTVINCNLPNAGKVTDTLGSLEQPDRAGASQLWWFPGLLICYFYFSSTNKFERAFCYSKQCVVSENYSIPMCYIIKVIWLLAVLQS